MASASATLASGDWRERDELGRAYLDATSHAYDGAGEGRAAGAAFGDRVARADAFVHVQDMAGQDVLDSDAFAEHEGGFAAAAAMRGATPEIYHVDSTQPERIAVRPLRQEIARVLRARAINPRWIAGQMRHGHRGASEIAETLDNLFAYAALTDAVESRQFDLYFDATLGDEAVRGFLVAANPLAAKGMAAKFAEASRRGFWRSRRNSSAAILARSDRGGRMSALARRREGMVPRRAAADADRRRPARARARLGGAAVVRPGRGARGCAQAIAATARSKFPRAPICNCAASKTSTLAELQSRLARLGLIDADPEAERVRNIVASPLSDLDPAAALDVAPVVAALEARLARRRGAAGVAGQIRLRDRRGRAVCRSATSRRTCGSRLLFAEGARFAVRLAGAARPAPPRERGGARRVSPLPVSYGEGPGVGLAAASAISPRDVPDVAARLARAFPASPATATMRRAACARSSSARARRRFSRRQALSQPRPDPRDGKIVARATRSASSRSASASPCGAAPPFGRIRAARLRGTCARRARATARAAFG